MIPNVVKGGDMRGLLRYLAGPGRANEHTHPHVIGGDLFAKAWHGSEELDAGAAAELASYLEEPARVFDTKMMAKAWQQDPATGARVPILEADGRQAYRDQHVWHCSLSLPPGEVLSAEQWDAVTSDFADRMGFTDASGKAPIRWAAIHHGPSKNGNDHVHIAANLIREDGTKWEGIFRDFPRAQAACRELEAVHGLTPVDGRQLETATRGAKPAELARAARAGAIPERDELATRIRAAAVASTSEAEWIRRVRADGVILKPRFAAGSTDVVAGYRAALKPASREARPNFYGGGQLGRDLTLPRVRECWPAADVDQAGAAAAEWQRAYRGQRPAQLDGRESRQLGELNRAAPATAAANLEAFARQLATTPAGDRRAWSDAARDVAGALSAWSRFDPEHAGELRQAAAVLARTAQQRRPGAESRRVKASPMGAAMVLLAAKSADKPAIAASVLLAQLLAAATAIAAARRAAGDERQAAAISAGVVRRLEQLRPVGYAPSLEAARPAQRPADRAPLPNPLAPRQHTGSRVDHGRQDHGRG